MATPRVKTQFTNTKGQRVTVMTDGTKRFSGGNQNTRATTDSLNTAINQVNQATSALGQRTGRSFQQLTPLGASGITSSDSVLNQRNQGDAMNMAANALVTSPTDMGGGFQLSPLQQQYSNMMFDQQNQNMDMFGELRRGVDLMYDAQLARTNFQYGNLMKDLTADFNKSTDIAAQQAAALNPYSQAQGAMTANNFQGAIRDRYQTQAARLQEAATIAQNELAAGNAQAYIEITNAMKQSNQQFQKGMMEFMMNAQASFQEAQMEERRFGLDVAKFGLQQQEFGENRFMNFINQFSQDPAFKMNLKMYEESGQINEGLMPLIERGMAAGLSPAETLSIAQYETADQRKQRIAEEQFQQQMNLGWYNAQTSRMNAVRQAQEGAEVKTSTAKVFNTRAQTIVDKGYQALSKLAAGGLAQTGIGGQLTSWIDASAAGDLDQVYNTIRGNISFDQLAQMRADSPTGGALGQVSNFEGQLLQDAEGALRASLRKDTQVTNLTNIMAAYINTQTAVALDAKVADGEMTQEQANQMMIENMVTADDVKADFNQRQQARQQQTQSSVQTNSQSTPAIGNYLNNFGY